MFKKIIPVITDTVFFAFVAFLLTLCLTAKSVKTPFSVIISATVSLLFSLLIFKFLLKRKNRNESEKQRKELTEQTLFCLAFYSEDGLRHLIESALVAGKKNFAYENGVLRLKEENSVYAVLSGADGLKKSDVVKLYNRLETGEKGKIFCLYADEETKDFCARFNGAVVIEDGEKFYAFLKKGGVLPEINAMPAKEKVKRFSAAVVLDKKRAAKYMLYGSVFSLMSLVVKLNAYYLVVGCGFLILSAITLVFGKSKVKNE